MKGEFDFDILLSITPPQSPSTEEPSVVTHHAFDRCRDDLTKVGGFISRFFQRGNQHDQDTAI